MSWKVEFRKTCKVCNEPVAVKRYRTFCSTKCRNKFNNKKYYPQNLERARKRRGAYSEYKKQCQICKRWYVQVGSHIVQVHRMTTRQYREEFDMPLKKGIIPDWYREKKSSQVSKEALANLKLGASNRFVKGDPRAKIKKREHGWKSSPNAIDNFSYGEI